MRRPASCTVPQAKTREVAEEEARAQRLDRDALSYALHGRSAALGVVGHWGHVHMRETRFEAVVTVAAQGVHGTSLVSISGTSSASINRAVAGRAAPLP